MFLSFFLPALNHDLFEINIVQCHLHVIFVMLQLKMLNSFCIICPSFGALLEMLFAPNYWCYYHWFSTYKRNVIFLSSVQSFISQPNRLTWLHIVAFSLLLLCNVYFFLFLFFLFYYFFFLFLRFVCLLLLNFVIRHKLFQYDHLVLLEQMLIENII